MLKIIAFLFLVYVFFKTLILIFRGLGGGPDVNRHTRYRSTEKPGGIRVDYDPQAGRKKQKYRGGEYVDYEEVE